MLAKVLLRRIRRVPCIECGTVAKPANQPGFKGKDQTSANAAVMNTCMKKINLMYIHNHYFYIGRYAHRQGKRERESYERVEKGKKEENRYIDKQT